MAMLLTQRKGTPHALLRQTQTLPRDGPDSSFFPVAHLKLFIAAPLPGVNTFTNFSKTALASPPCREQLHGKV